MALADESFEVNILPSAAMDIVRGRYFYDQQTIYYKVGGRAVTVWRVLDQRFDSALCRCLLARSRLSGLSRFPNCQKKDYEHD